jgi:acetyl esterase/lipase
MSNPPANARKRGKRKLFWLALLVCASVPVALQAQAPVNNQNAALLAFKREQIALLEAHIGPDSYYPQRELTEALAETRNRATQIETSVGDAANTRYTLHERAYFAPDGSPQPYWVALPSNYTPNKKWPLIVYLHGYSTDISKSTRGSRPSRCSMPLASAVS